MEESKRRGTLQVPDKLSQAIVIAAKQWRTTTHELVRAAWEEYLERHPEGPVSEAAKTDPDLGNSLQLTSEKSGIVQLPSEYSQYPESIQETLRTCARILMSRYAKALTENAATFADGLNAREELERAINAGSRAPNADEADRNIDAKIAESGLAEGRVDEATKKLSKFVHSDSGSGGRNRKTGTGAKRRPAGRSDG